MNLKLTPLYAALIALISITSCKTSSDVISDRGIQKRKYNKGFYLAQKSSVPQVKSVAPEVESTSSMSETSSEVDRPTQVVVNNRTEAQSAVVTNTAAAKTAQTQSASTPSAAKKTSDALAQITPEKTKRQTGPASFKIKPRATASTQLPLERGEFAADETETLLLVILAILLPPLAVYLLRGIGTEFWISVLLTLLFWLPGIIYALYLILA